MTTVLSADELGLVNCAGCRRELLGERTADLIFSGKARTDATLPPPVSARVAGRPVCGACEYSVKYRLIRLMKDPEPKLSRVLRRGETVRSRTRPRKIDAAAAGDNESGVRHLEGD